MNEFDIEYMELNHLRCLSAIGNGGYGTVYLVYDHHYNEKFALKSVKRSRFKESEVECMMKLLSPYVINLYKYEFYKDNVYLLMEYCPSTLRTIISSRGLGTTNTIS